VRSQDILQCLLERFDFHLFIAFSNIVDVFIDRSFGHNFRADQDWDRAFIDRLHAFDEQALASRLLTPTHMMAVMTSQPCLQHLRSRGLTPENSVRNPHVSG
jgi:hypothetical protein